MLRFPEPARAQAAAGAWSRAGLGLWLALVAGRAQASDFQPLDVRLPAGTVPAGPAEAWLSWPPGDNLWTDNDVEDADFQPRLRFIATATGDQWLRFWAPLRRGQDDQSGLSLHVSVGERDGSEQVLHPTKDDLKLSDRANERRGLVFAGSPGELAALRTALHALPPNGSGERDWRQTQTLVPPDPPAPGDCVNDLGTLRVVLDRGPIAAAAWVRCASEGAHLLALGVPSASALRRCPEGEICATGAGEMAWLAAPDDRAQAVLTELEERASSGFLSPSAFKGDRAWGTPHPRLVGVKATLFGFGLPIVAVLMLGLWAGRRPRRTLWLWLGIPAIAAVDGLLLMAVATPPPVEQRVSIRMDIESPEGTGYATLGEVTQRTDDLSLEDAFPPGSAVLSVLRTQRFGSPFAVPPPIITVEANPDAHRLRLERLQIPRGGQGELWLTEPLSESPVAPRLSREGASYVIYNPSTSGPLSSVLLVVGSKLGWVRQVAPGERRRIEMGPLTFPRPPPAMNADDWSQLVNTLSSVTRSPVDTYALAAETGHLPATQREIRIVVGSLEALP